MVGSHSHQALCGGGKATFLRPPLGLLGLSGPCPSHPCPSCPLPRPASRFGTLFPGAGGAGLTNWTELPPQTEWGRIVLSGVRRCSTGFARIRPWSGVRPLPKCCVPGLFQPDSVLFVRRELRNDEKSFPNCLRSVGARLPIRRSPWCEDPRLRPRQRVGLLRCRAAAHRRRAAVTEGVAQTWMAVASPRRTTAGTVSRLISTQASNVARWRLATRTPRSTQ